ncbi:MULTISPECIES: type 1 glutamine amidotransferase [unclassified Micromonospora]|uniref:type 1 glutamine amidotransferase n=1 Tax=unclassified Micromonospora TaxID=2617518 RepID=UPI00103324DA|nr:MULTISPECIES: type 1 glutamine amidotransferase [unclassified Micromonospora]QKW15718.1 type 1 glutamine amidotransferase [Verrucosispora sp. NA02020]TBL31220.1 type 1 glutamine amidotransferase [Verrucosispora sp. SN26_14.1]
MATALVIENDPTDDARRLGEWLTEAGLELSVSRPHAGDPLPADLDGYAALVVLGGDQQAYPDPDGKPGASWLPAVEGLLRKAVRHRVPTLGVCLGAQLLATAHAGTVERSRSGPEVGPAVVGRRDAAENDPLFRYVPLIPDVLQWHTDEITELPAGATLLAASTRFPHQAFRLGDRAWGLQFHIECDADMIAEWATDSAVLAELDYDPELVVAACAAVLADVEDVWQPFAARFAALALGELDDSGSRRTLPLLGH